MSSKLTPDQHLDLYYFMLLNRRLEDRLVKLFRQNKIVGGVIRASARRRFRLARLTR